MPVSVLVSAGLELKKGSTGLTVTLKVELAGLPAPSVMLR